MKVYSPDALPMQEFSVTFINALAQYWHTTRSFQCFGNPKREHLLLFLDGCRISYTDKAGNRLEAGPGDVVYTPAGSEYRAVLSDFRDESAHTVGINFRICDTEGEAVALSDGILIFEHLRIPSAPLLFRRALSVDEKTPLARRILLLEILDVLCRPSQPDISEAIRPALCRLNEEGGGVPSVGELSDACHISEPYFRKLFKKSVGLSPAAYRKRLLLERACNYLTYGDISIGEISELLGYASVSHFIKEFGCAYGISPLQYRKASRME